MSRYIEGDYKIIRILKGPSFFSFWSYIFINEHKLDITHEEFQHILFHEKVHVQQRHTIDIILMEIVGIICWFNPFVRKIKHALCQTHEFIADGKTVGGTQEIESYSRLILRLSSGNKSMPLTHQFSMINIKNRIAMLNQSKTETMKTYKLLLSIPVILLLMSVFSCTDKPVKSIADKQTNSKNDQELFIGEITWEGNTKYSDAMLTRVLSVKTGDSYDKAHITERMTFNNNNDDISSLYMDNGYLFYNIDAQEEVVGNTVNLKFKVYEGGPASVDKIIIKGNTKVKTSKVLDMLEFTRGDLFNRSEIVQSQKNIAESGFLIRSWLTSIQFLMKMILLFLISNLC